MILPADPLVIPQPGFQSDFVGWSDPTRSDQARYRIHRSGMVNGCNECNSGWMSMVFISNNGWNKNLLNLFLYFFFVLSLILFVYSNLCRQRSIRTDKKKKKKEKLIREYTSMIVWFNIPVMFHKNSSYRNFIIMILVE